MKIAIDCADLDHSRIDGTRVYIKNVLNWLGKIDSQDQFFLFHQRDFNPILVPEKFPNYFDEKIPYKFWWTQTRFAYELLQLKPDVCWMPIQQLPYLINKKIKTVVTIHDLAFKIFPDSFTRGDKFKLNLFTDYAVKNADRIIAVSQSTKKDILRFYPKISEDKIMVVYHGVNQSQMLDLKCKNNDLKPKAINAKYVLYLGAIQPRKDLGTLVEAFEALKSRENQPLSSSFLFREEGQKILKLVIAGAVAWQAEKILEKIKKSKFSKDIILLGKVSFEEAVVLYRNAEVFVMPSLYEGFGMPILEAWASKTSVIVANNSSLKEIGADAVLKFETKDSQDLAKKIEKILKDDRIREELINKGTERLKLFSWEKCARETLEVLKSV